LSASTVPFPAKGTARIETFSLVTAKRSQEITAMSGLRTDKMMSTAAQAGVRVQPM
jgi:hypothetical protein